MNRAKDAAIIIFIILALALAGSLDYQEARRSEAANQAAAR